MIDVDYGHVRKKLADLMAEQNISINKLAFRAEMQRTQLKAYMKEDIQRVDLAVISRLCYALECDLNDLIEYIPPNPRWHNRKILSKFFPDIFCNSNTPSYHLIKIRCRPLYFIFIIFIKVLFSPIKKTSYLSSILLSSSTRLSLADLHTFSKKSLKKVFPKKLAINFPP